MGDVHFCQYSSIVRKRGEYYSARLENCIRSLIWVETLAEKEGCSAIIYLGDFFDKPELNAEEITALQEIHWSSDITHYFITGNHELSGPDYSSAQLMHIIPKAYVASTLSQVFMGETSLIFLPYMIRGTEDETLGNLVRDIEDYRKYSDKIVIFSHNDLKGIQMGSFMSQEGIDIEFAHKCCDLFFNGHLHNGCKISDKIINVGNLTGLNFSEDAYKYPHHVVILDTDSLNYKFVDNPYAFNFYKDEITEKPAIEQFKNKYKNHAVLSIKCPLEYVNDLKDIFQQIPQIEESRIIVVSDHATSQTNITELVNTDHIAQFIQYVQNHIETSDYLLKELQEL